MKADKCLAPGAAPADHADIGGWIGHSPCTVPPRHRINAQYATDVLIDEAEQAGARLEFVTEKFEDTAIGRFILAARAFVAEVEREKIAERTMRGKLERARSGRIPQAMGKGCYGYMYNPAT